MARPGGAQEQILPLLRERALPLSNNQAERQIRPASAHDRDRDDEPVRRSVTAPARAASAVASVRPKAG